MGVSTQYATNDMRMSHMTFVDCAEGGLSLMIGGEGDNKKIKANDIAIYGESDDLADDCGGNDCYCK